jgi:hypothetical protein
MIILSVPLLNPFNVLFILSSNFPATIISGNDVIFGRRVLGNIPHIIKLHTRMRVATPVKPTTETGLMVSALTRDAR